MKNSFKQDNLLKLAKVSLNKLLIVRIDKLKQVERDLQFVKK